ncbi:3647_t:CDS:2 [Scutellospora calospora]|uniref:3647_t:CDS:1 n=1 Tax=Scutellospora calospora TaxID=85575 RepID=A0ACA9K1Z9_9GLOM|nr:3647_t:CDS:2 [Scutellospora calospora]
MRCWNAQPEKRPTSKELFLTILEWHDVCFSFMQSYRPEYTEQIEKSEKIINQFLESNTNTSLDYKLHPGAIYTSRLLKTSNLLPLPVNTVEYENQLSRLYEDSQLINLQVSND